MTQTTTQQRYPDWPCGRCGKKITLRPGSHRCPHCKAKYFLTSLPNADVASWKMPALKARPGKEIK